VCECSDRGGRKGLRSVIEAAPGEFNRSVAGLSAMRPVVASTLPSVLDEPVPAADDPESGSFLVSPIEIGKCEHPTRKEFPGFDNALRNVKYSNGASGPFVRVAPGTYEKAADAAEEVTSRRGHGWGGSAEDFSQPCGGTKGPIEPLPACGAKYYSYAEFRTFEWARTGTRRADEGNAATASDKLAQVIRIATKVAKQRADALPCDHCAENPASRFTWLRAFVLVNPEGSAYAWAFAQYGKECPEVGRIPVPTTLIPGVGRTGIPTPRTPTGVATPRDNESVRSEEGGGMRSVGQEHRAGPMRPFGTD
jgi:hypothetical protein